MTAGSRSSPAIASAGSPGNNRCSPKINSDTKNRVGTISAMRRTRKAIIGPAASLQRDPLWPDQPVGIGRKAGELRAHRVEPFLVPEIDDRSVGKDDRRELAVGRHAVGLSARGAPSVKLRVGVGVAIMTGVQRRRRLAGNEVVD